MCLTVYRLKRKLKTEIETDHEYINTFLRLLIRRQKSFMNKSFIVKTEAECAM